MVLLIVIELVAATVAGLLMRLLYETEREPDQPDTGSVAAAA